MDFSLSLSLTHTHTHTLTHKYVGPLVGKTVKQVRFRTRYGAAVIAVHRDGSRIHEHPGRIRLQGGDVLLLEAGPTFIKGSYDNDRAFSLLAEVKDSGKLVSCVLFP